MKKKPDLTDSELLSFALKDVKPLPGRTINMEKSFKRGKVIASSNKKTFTTQDKTRKPAYYPKLSMDETPGLDRNSAKRMKRGKMRIDAELDLHGYNQEEARRILFNFISNAAKTKKRCVLVITGKGLHQQKENRYQTGVLRKMLPNWLNEEPNRSQIIGFSQAKPLDGGSGAVYVMLKRNREGRG